MTLLERDEKNREEARNEERIRFAKKLIKRGCDDDFILETTELSLEVIQTLDRLQLIRQFF